MQDDIINISQFLFLSSWFAFAGVVFILALIARFYQNLSGKQTYYRFFAIPIFTFGVGIARYVSIGRWTGDWLGDSLFSITGVLLSGLCYVLYKQMTTRRN
jgi:hypothetical protein